MPARCSPKSIIFQLPSASLDPPISNWKIWGFGTCKWSTRACQPTGFPQCMGQESGSVEKHPAGLSSALYPACRSNKKPSAVFLDHPSLESQSKPGIQMVYPEPCKELGRRISAAIYVSLPTFIYPGYDCGSLECLFLGPLGITSKRQRPHRPLSPSP